MSSDWQNIESKSDLKRFIDMDLKARGQSRLPGFYQVRKPIIYFTVLLRKAEYLENTKHGYLGKLRCKFLKLRVKRLGAKLGFSVPLNTCGPGLYLVHWGSVVISSLARIGPNARIHSCVNISGAPVIGEHVYLGPGAIVVGDITLGDHVTVGANSVAATSFPDKVTVLGNPARVVKKHA